MYPGKPMYQRAQIRFKDAILDVLIEEITVEDDHYGFGKRYTLVVNDRMPRVKFPAEGVEPKNLARKPHMMNTIEYEADVAMNRATGLGPGTADRQRELYQYMLDQFMKNSPPIILPNVRQQYGP